MSEFEARQYECGCAVETTDTDDWYWLTCPLHDEPVDFGRSDRQESEDRLVDLRVDEGDEDWLRGAEPMLGARVVRVYEMGMEYPPPEDEEFIEALIDLRDAINNVLREAPTHDGQQDLWSWWGLSYAAFLTMPRLLMHDMHDDWQRRMAELLEEYFEEFPNRPPVDVEISMKDPETGEFLDVPDWLLDYRHPDRDKIDAFRDHGQDWEDEF